IPRTLLFGQRRLRLAVATQLMVKPESSGLIGRKLARAYVSGVQDVSLSDASSDGARLLAECVGGDNVMAYGFGWTRVLCPARHALTQLERPPLRVLVYLARPFARALDAVRRRSWPGRWVLTPGDRVQSFDIANPPPEFAGLLAQWQLRPLYDAPSVQAILGS